MTTFATTTLFIPDGVNLSMGSFAISTKVSESLPTTGTHTSANSRFEGFSCRYESIALSSLTAPGSSFSQHPPQSQPSELEVSHVIEFTSSSEHCWPRTEHDLLHAWPGVSAETWVCIMLIEDPRSKSSMAAVRIVAGVVKGTSIPSDWAADALGGKL